MLEVTPSLRQSVPSRLRCALPGPAERDRAAIVILRWLVMARLLCAWEGLGAGQEGCAPACVQHRMWPRRAGHVVAKSSFPTTMWTRTRRRAARMQGIMTERPPLFPDRPTSLLRRKESTPRRRGCVAAAPSRPGPPMIELSRLPQARSLRCLRKAARCDSEAAVPGMVRMRACLAVRHCRACAAASVMAQRDAAGRHARRLRPLLGPRRAAAVRVGARRLCMSHYMATLRLARTNAAAVAATRKTVRAWSAIRPAAWTLWHAEAVSNAAAAATTARTGPGRRDGAHRRATHV